MTFTTKKISRKHNSIFGVDFAKVEFDFSKVEFDFGKVEFDFAKVEFDFGKVEFDFAKVEFDFAEVEFDFGKVNTENGIMLSTYFLGCKSHKRLVFRLLKLFANLKS